MLSLWLLPFAPCHAATSANDLPLPSGAAATVNGEVIAESLVAIFLKNDREALNIDPRTAEGAETMAKLRVGVLDELIDRQLIAQGVQTLGVAPTEAQIDAAERKMLEFCGTPARYDAYVAQNGFTRQTYRDAVLRPTANGSALAAALTRDLNVSDEEVKNYFATHPTDADLQWPERVTAAHILINAQPGVLTARLERERKLTPSSPEMEAAVVEETARRRALAEDIRKQALMPDADFAVLAKKYSDDLGTRDAGGLLGTFAKGTHPLALDDVLFALKPGEISAAIPTEFGFHIARVLEHRSAGLRTLEEASPTIRRRLLATRHAERLRQWLAESRAKAVIVRADQSPLPPGATTP